MSERETDTSREAIAEYRRRALTQPLYSSGGEVSELPEFMADALLALRDALDAAEQERDAACKDSVAHAAHSRKLEDALSAAQADMRKMAAKLTRGVVIENHYRRWPHWNPDGDLHKDRDLVAFADATADAILALPITGEDALASALRAARREGFAAGWKVNAVDGEDDTHQAYLDGCLKVDYDEFEAKRNTLANKGYPHDQR
jgi:hypothetical protein